MLELLIHRTIEMGQHGVQCLNSVISKLGLLLRFHPRPVSFLYSTFFYHHKRLLDLPEVKRRLVLKVYGMFSDLRLFLLLHWVFGCSELSELPIER